MTKVKDWQARPGLKGEAERIGFFGKLPTHGDFVSWGLTVKLQRALEDWLQIGLRTAQDGLGESWLRTFKAMPPWRFFIEEGLWSSHGVAGVIVPSSDRVGREFPLVLLAQIQQAGEHPFRFYKDETWFTAVETIARSASHKDFQLDSFTESLEKLRAPRAIERRNEEEGRNGSRTVKQSLWWTILPNSQKVRGFRNEGGPGKEDLLRLLQAGDITLDLTMATPPPLPAQLPAEAVVSPAVYQTHSLGHAQPLLCWNSAFRSHEGTGGQPNTDALLASNAAGLFAVADGLEGDPSAAEAARLTIQLVGQAVREGPLEQRLQELKGKLGTANTLLRRRAEGRATNGAGAASLAALLLSGDDFAVLWAGDARCYLLRDSMLRYLTRDHIEIGMRRSLSRAVGLAPTLQMERVGEKLRPQDTFLLCTAPLVRAVPERAIAEIMLSEAAADVPRVLIETALISGCPGNMTALVVQTNSP
ncbi:type VI secretion system-associated protein TagF [Rhizobium sp. FKY42]|uniref:type VI secretion system-associated protein TagF n=1 Tax=Rhizobium sp. FKY42 TaxID=2562310 RepID=UPI00148548DC|nr:type VI secretion system-associated protein TagF [Rhizobium sp. FKY42]